jgi:hypothetical protein
MYYNNQPCTLQVTDHVFMELDLVELFKTAMDISWCVPLIPTKPSPYTIIQHLVFVGHLSDYMDMKIHISIIALGAPVFMRMSEAKVSCHLMRFLRLQWDTSNYLHDQLHTKSWS